MQFRNQADVRPERRPAGYPFHLQRGRQRLRLVLGMGAG